MWRCVILLANHQAISGNMAIAVTFNCLGSWNKHSIFDFWVIYRYFETAELIEVDFGVWPSLAVV